MKETETSLRESLQALPRAAWILFFGTFLNKFGTFVLPFLAIYMTRLGYTTSQAGMAIAAYGIGSLGASLLGGYLADRLGRRKTIVLSMFSVALVAAEKPLRVISRLMVEKTCTNTRPTASDAKTTRLNRLSCHTTRSVSSKEFCARVTRTPAGSANHATRP